MGWLHRTLDQGQAVAEKAIETGVGPAWRRVTDGESRLIVSLAILVAVGLQVSLPDRIANHPRGLVSGVAVALLVGILVVNPRRINRQSTMLRGLMLGLIGVMSAANAVSGARLVVDLVEGTGIRDAKQLLLTGGAIWVTNVIVFALWYWEFDRGGPASRAQALRLHPDFLFPQMTVPELTPAHWDAEFVDYLYLSFTNATAFSPTDVMPLSRWSKMTMMLQSTISLVLAALVIARAVNILG